MTCARVVSAARPDKTEHRPIFHAKNSRVACLQWAPSGPRAFGNSLAARSHLRASIAYRRRCPHFTWAPLASRTRLPGRCFTPSSTILENRAVGREREAIAAPDKADGARL